MENKSAKTPIPTRQNSDLVSLTHEELSVGDIVAAVTDPECGGISVFVGTTRDLFEDKEVVSLEYEAYVPMAEAEMRKICGEVRERWPVKHIAIVHRLGPVAVTESSIVVATCSIHRTEAIAATTYVMDVLKARVPVWKRELYSDGSKSWKENKECEWSKKN